MIEDLLDTLSSEGLQSDERFAESFMHHRVNKGQGPMKINQELRQRGIEQNLIEIVLESESIDWCSLAGTVRVKKFGETCLGTIKRRQNNLDSYIVAVLAVMLLTNF